MMLPVSNILRCQRLIQNTVRILLRNLPMEAAAFPVAWEKPKIGWTKLNFDGSSEGKAGRPSIGGLFRNHKAEFILVYAEQIGMANSTIAELAALHRGLELVQENGWNDVWLEGDAKTLIDNIAENRTFKSAEVQKHVSDIKLIILTLDDWTATHVYREGNRAADKFAQIGRHLDKPTVWRHIPPDEVLPIMHEDAEGKIVFRRRS